MRYVDLRTPLAVAEVRLHAARHRPRSSSSKLTPVHRPAIALILVGLMLGTGYASAMAATSPTPTPTPSSSGASRYTLSLSPNPVLHDRIIDVTGKAWRGARLRLVVAGGVDPNNSRFRAGEDGTFSVGYKATKAPGTYRVTVQAYTAGRWTFLASRRLTIVSTLPATPAPATAPAPTPTVAPSAPTPAPDPTVSPTASHTATPSPAPTPKPSPSATPAGFVTRQGTKLYLDGREYRFTGLNIYNANSRNNCWYSMGNNDSVLETALADIGDGKEAFRAWFFQRMAQTNGQRDWSAFDHTLAVARAYGQKVIVTLTDHWGACDSPQKGDWFYGSGYRNVQPGDRVSYRAWAQEVVSRYKDDPTILMWQMVNEAESATSAALYGFASDMGKVIRSIDARHLISLGTIGSGQAGTAGDDYRKLHSIPEIDVCEYHDYRPGSEYFPSMPSQLQERLDQCNTLGKPLFIGESGIKLDEVGGSLSERARLFEAKLTVQFDAGVVGYLPWAWVGRGQSAYEAYLIGPGDPGLDVLGRH
jgi:mannan endo-1,4-beta-mannosidase